METPYTCMETVYTQCIYTCVWRLHYIYIHVYGDSTIHTFTYLTQCSHSICIHVHMYMETVSTQCVPRRLQIVCLHSYLYIHLCIYTYKVDCLSCLQPLSTFCASRLQITGWRIKIIGLFCRISSVL